MVSDAAFRRPPFQLGEKEKGFRDSIVLESFVQLLVDSPSSPTACRVALVSGDELLRTAASARIATAQNGHILESVDALRDLINTLGSTVGEEFIASIRPKAAKLFYVADQKETLYYKWNIIGRLKTSLATAEIALPSGADRYEIEKWLVNSPRFVRKEGQRIEWVSRFEARLRAMKSAQYTSWPAQSSLIVSASAPLPGVTPVPTSLPPTVSPSPFLANFGLGSLSGPTGPVNTTVSYTDAQQVAAGVATVDVSWSATVTTLKRVKAPEIGTVAFVEVVWE